jgi:hypothetical protein
LRNVLQNIAQRAKETQHVSKQFEFESGSRSDLFNSVMTEKEEMFEVISKDRAKVKYTRSVEDIILRKQGAQAPHAKRIILEWFDPLRSSIRAKQHDVISGKIQLPKKLFTSLTADKLAILTIHDVFSTLLLEKV